ncbi:MAG TPA: hypothetical protein VFL69_08395 [Marmoricola sp.]|nr:hypothetical protein [Marmoricola sp.]
MTDEPIEESARRARLRLSRLSDEGGLLQQIESGAWRDRMPFGDPELQELIDNIGDRARLDRIVIERLAQQQRPAE